MSKSDTRDGGQGDDRGDDRERRRDPRRGAAAAAPYCVLLADDSEVRQAIWVPALEHEGYRVLSALDGEEALLLAEEEKVDLVLLDVDMPKMDGFQVLETLRRQRPSQKLAIIMMTGQDQDEDVLKGFRLGADDYVPIHSFSRDVVLARIQAQLRNRVPVAAFETPTERVGYELGPGSVLDGKYRLDSLIGKGNFGTVYRATHIRLQRPVAVKVLRTSFGADQVSVVRFQQEGVSLSRLHHPNAVAVLDFSITDDGVTYLVMELLEGHILEREMSLGQLDMARCAEIIIPVCDVLTEAHSLGIIHRDIKPQNIFLHTARRGEQVKVLDFGIAKMVGDADLKQRLTIEGNSVGTPAYMAPERFTNDPYDGRTDVYSLGVTAYEMLAGRTPFASADGNFFKLIRMHVVEPPRPLRQHDPSIPEEIEDIVGRTLAKACADRPTPAEVAKVFARVAGTDLPSGLGESSPPAATEGSDTAKQDRSAAPTEPSLELFED
ncbi:MAG: protein kinase [Holophagales bacterium]|nr:protein kinase [Holophagales bacterium]